MGNIADKTVSAFKWSSITEVLTKMVSPVVNMILARILAPEAFGVLATVTMVISFAEVFVESGFQKFLIQHNFDTERREQEFMSVAFWANLMFSGFIWGLVILFCRPLAAFAGNAGLGYLIAITGVTIPLYGIIGIQDCRLKKKLEFKQLFWVRILSALVPLAVTLPLALLGFGYWSLIIGNIAGVVVRSVLLVYIGRFRPSKYFNIRELRFMLSFGIWTMLDGAAIWATNWIDSLLISHYMSSYYLGLYKNSIATITSIFAIITAAITPVLFSSLSKLQSDSDQFNSLFLKVQKVLCTFLLPIGVGIYFYRDTATYILFGDKWAEAADILGIIAVTTALRTILISFYSDAYRAKGRFHLPLIMQLIDVAIIVPVCIISVKHGFWPLVYARAFVKLDLVLPEMFVVWKVCGISPQMTGKAVCHPIIAAGVMTLGIFIVQSMGNSFKWSLISIVICAVLYFAALFLFKSEREQFLKLVRNKKPLYTEKSDG